MRQTISRLDAVRLIARAREAVCEPAVLQDLLDDWQTTTVVDALAEEYAAVGNGFLSQICEAITGRQIEVTGEPAARLPCPCCHRRTLSERFDVEAGTGYDICDHCDWEDDGTSDDRAYSGVNHGSMADYREHMRSAQNYYLRDKWRE